MSPMPKPSAETARQPCSQADSFIQRSVSRYANGGFSACPDSIIQEHEAALYLDNALFSTFTCSPWNIEELAVGKLRASGAIQRFEDITELRVSPDQSRIDVKMATHAQKRHTDHGRVIAFSDALEINQRLHRSLDAAHIAGAGASAAGAKPNAGAPVEPRGAASPFNNSLRDASKARCLGAEPGSLRLAPEEVLRRIALLETGSALFHKTGGVHSAVLVGAKGIVAWTEDVGRHSAMDKLIGWCTINSVSAAHCSVSFSGRVPLEIMAKVACLGCPMIISPGAPTNLSIEFAQEHGITVVGFAKRGRFNVYAHPERIR